MGTTPNPSGKTNILVTGDFILDYNIIKQPASPSGYRDSLSSSVMENQAGGAWYLSELIKNIHENFPSVVYEPKFPVTNAQTSIIINRAFQVWSKFKEEIDGNKKSIWRIESFLGCEKNEGVDLKNRKLQYSFYFPENEHEHDILVIDDISLGFVEDINIVDDLLHKIQNVKNIILKTHSHQFNSYLWKCFAKNGLLKKTTVVTTSDCLREGGAYINRGFSWDNTIEETTKEFDSGLFSIIFSQCKRVIVLFDKFGIASFTNESLQLKLNGSEIPENKLTFEKFVYDCQNCEGAWDKKYKGSIYGSLSILTAAVTMLYTEYKFSLSYIFNLALNCIHKNIELGGGIEDNINFSAINPFLKEAFSLNIFNNDCENKDIIKNKKKFEDSLKKFYSAYPSYYTKCQYGIKKSNNSFNSNLLSDVAGYGAFFLYAKAVEIIMRGPDKALKQVPLAKFGNYQTYDREEIERINSINKLIHVYLSQTSDKRPLSFAVFGSPGSGKSFAIKQLLESIFGRSNEPLVFNLTQFNNISELHQALHIVRDRTVKGAIPLVFWDEFDTNSNSWLKEFLAPMQDGEFSEGSIIHPLGRAIFIFAGGTCDSFEEYQEKTLPQKDIKGPDFISRLRGFVDIKGPNRIQNTLNTSQFDEAFIIRRAILIHFNLKKYHTPIFEKNNVPSISPGVLNALLKIKEYKHGARSIDSIISLSRTGNNKQFDTSSLPSPELLKIHVSDDFIDLVHEGELEYPLIENLAEAIHNEWKKEKMREGYKWGEKRNDDPEILTHPRLLDYNKLPKEEWKEDNRITARLTKAKFMNIGYYLIPPHLQKNNDLTFDNLKEKQNALIEQEHDIWLQSHLIDGFEYCEITDEHVLLHKDIAKSDKLSSVEIGLDKAIVDATIEVLKEHNYKLRKL
jgi:hypothetical protein